MFMQSMLAEKKTRANRRVPAARKKPLKKIGSGGKRNGSGGTVTDGHDPHYGTSSLPFITPWKIILTSFLIGICGILYITHVFSTQQLLQEVRQLENEYSRISRIHAERRLAYDRQTGPKEIYQRAREEGFVNAGPADRVIQLKR